MTSSQKNTSSSLSYPDEMTGCWCTQNTILADKYFLDSICSSNFGNQLHYFWVVISAITTNHKGCTLWSLGYSMEDGSDKVLGIMVLLEDHHFLAEPRPVNCKLKLRNSCNSGGAEVESSGALTFLVLAPQMVLFAQS